MRKNEEPFNFKKDSDTSSQKKKATTDDEPKRLKRYFASSLKLDDIEKLPKGQRGGADAVLVSYRASKKAGERIHKHHLYMIICDEAQVMRRVTGLYAKMVQLFHWGRLLFFTGTPIASSLRDLLSPLTLIAYANKAIRDLKGLSSDVVRYVPSLYDEGYAAYKLDNEIIDEFGQTLGTTKGMFCKAF
jgi:hypothetical protein